MRTLIGALLLLSCACSTASAVRPATPAALPAASLSPLASGATCHIRYTSHNGIQEPLPDPSCTPGAIDPAVRQDNLATTICRKGGYTSSVRPPNLSAEKIASMREYGVSGPPSAYEYDHLISLELGGSSAPSNLWPEPGDRGTLGYPNNKDDVENRLKKLTCDGVITLSEAQNCIRTDWVACWEEHP